MYFSTKIVPFRTPSPRRSAPCETLLDLGRRGDLLHPLPPAAARRLDEDRPADPVAEPDHLFRVVDVLEGRGHRHAGGGERLAGLDLVAHDAHDAGGGADERHLLPLHRIREIGVLREEAVPREDRVAPRVFRRAQDRVDIEVAHGGGRRPQAHRLVGELYVERQGVAVGVPTTTGILSSRAGRMARQAISLGSR